MRITKAEVLIVDLPLVNPFSLSFGKIDRRATVIIKLTSSTGIIGWGEAAALPVPLYNYETVDTTVLILKKFLIPSIIDKEFPDTESFVNTYQQVKGHNFAKCGLECAFWCLLSLERNQCLSQLFGGNRKKIAVGESIGIKDSAESTIEEIQLRLSEGYRRIKVKIKPSWDISLLIAIRNKFPTIDLMVDANSSYSLKDIETIKEFDQFSLMMIEQPLGETDIIDHSALQKQIKTAICLDESILSAEDARKALEIDACKIINIKPGRVGGILESIKINNYCAEKDIPVWCGGMLESGIGRAFNIALSSKQNFSLPADMSPSAIFYEQDLMSPTYSVDVEGFVAVSQIPGLGYEIDESALKKFTRETIVIERE